MFQNNLSPPKDTLLGEVTALSQHCFGQNKTFPIQSNLVLFMSRQTVDV